MPISPLIEAFCDNNTHKVAAKCMHPLLMNWTCHVLIWKISGKARMDYKYSDW